jgi:hypothetical protein
VKNLQKLDVLHNDTFLIITHRLIILAIARSALLSPVSVNITPGPTKLTTSENPAHWEKALKS